MTSCGDGRNSPMCYGI